MEEAGGVRDMAARRELVAHLDGATGAGAFDRRTHLLAVIHRESHGLLHVDVLAGIESGDEMLGVEMLRSGDEDRVDRGVLKHAAIFKMLARGGSDGARFFQTAGVNVGHAGTLGVGTGEGIAQKFGTAGAGADNGEANAIISAEGRWARRGCRRVRWPCCR